MRGSRCGAAWLAFAAIIFVSVSAAGCTARVRYYDEEHHDYHRWNNHEVVVYHAYWDGRHQPYRNYSNLNRDEQRDYWKWRHEHN
jgi:hypothetical protein